MPSVVTSRQPTRASARPIVSREVVTSEIAKGALPQYELAEAIEFPDPDPSDADKTLKRRAVRPRAASSEEIGAEDILEALDGAQATTAGATQEVTVGDILEVVDKLAELDAHIPVAKKREPIEARALKAPRERTWEGPGHSSFAPVALDVALPVCRVEPAIEIDWDLPAPPRRSMTPFIAGALVVVCGLVSAAIVRRGVRSDSVPPPIALLASSNKVAAAPPVAFVQAPMPTIAVPLAVSHDVPVVDVSALPRSPIGTINGLAGHRLFIDGHVARGASAEVKCGLHVVKVGSAGVAKMVDVPCGGEITVR